MLQAILIKIAVKRAEKKFTQNYMASQLGISQSYYNKIENGKKEITLKKIIEITTILNIDIQELFNQKNKSLT